MFSIKKEVTVSLIFTRIITSMLIILWSSELVSNSSTFDKFVNSTSSKTRRHWKRKNLISSRKITLLLIVPRLLVHPVCISMYLCM